MLHDSYRKLLFIYRTAVCFSNSRGSCMHEQKAQYRSKTCILRVSKQQSCTIKKGCHKHGSSSFGD